MNLRKFMAIFMILVGLVFWGFSSKVIAKTDSVKKTEQTTCPVMGNPIDKKVFTTYKDKKVYFCCKGCISTFEKDPEKYLPKLPQFAK